MRQENEIGGMTAPTEAGAGVAKPYGVECIGHTWATCPVWFATMDRAVQCAKNMAPDAIKTTVYDCTSGPIGVPVLVIDQGKRSPTGAQP